NEICGGNTRGVSFSKTPNLSIFPNPVSNNLHMNIKAEIEGEYKIELQNILGESKTLTTWHLDKEQKMEKDFNFETTNIESGSFFLIFTNPYETVTERILIVK